ncbi:PREDICTED: leucine-rich repeat transmembrane protein FLRT1-like [Eufriesea mexicana]|uniref:leucine-rich repeat transmembrane protein FLRT1-like n=1 Tax=Eufriesea mexicana TaxID=516756 RepID=UPI00083C7A6B|nr:PREDICTED: leucine-rich repeat transmembrane protein FLRT1-like [Eufriesea mexicana]
MWSSHVFLVTLNSKIAEPDDDVGNVTNEFDTLKKSSGVGRTLDSRIGGRMSPSYCKIGSCDAITCSSIPNGANSGALVSSFIENDFKANCKDESSVKLSFDNCKFPEDTLRRNWLSTNLSIERLAFSHCSLSEIEDDAFSSPIYQATKNLILVNNKLVSLRRAMFRHLEALEELSIQENIVKSAELNLLEDVAGSLTILDLNHVIQDREVLRNVTGGNTLSKLRILCLSGNSISMIDASLFVGVPMVISVYLHDSNIATVSQNALDPMASSIQQMTLYKNRIASLPEGLLDSVMRSNQPFRLHIHDNPWYCDCSLKWFQELILSSNIVATIPTCESPQTNAGKLFTTAEFCPQSTSTELSTSIKTTNDDWTSTSQTLPSTTTKNFCNLTILQTANSRKLLSTEMLQVPSRFPNFYVSKTFDSSILVNLPSLKDGVTLLWFDNKDVDSSLRCARNVKHSYLVKNIDPQTTYTICLVDDNGYTVSPLNCLAVATKPTYKFRTWLTNADKSLVLPLLISLLVLLFLVGGVLSFLLIRRHPSLLRGNKRVILVKQRSVDAIVLPKGVDIDEKEQRQANTACYIGRSPEDGYVTPLPPIRVWPPSRSSTSMQSDGISYVSNVEPTESQLDSWRLSRMKSELEKGKLVAPPLPPHPCHSIPSVSKAVDAKDDREYQAITV